MTRIYLTGGIAIEHDGDVRVAERDLPGRQGRLGFVFLVSERHRPVQRDRLVEVLWADGDEPASDSTFSAVLSRLRALLRKAGLDGATIDVDHASISLRLPADTWVDLEAASNAIDLCEGALRSGDLGKAWGHANVAIVVAKRPLLPGEDAPWIETLRRRQQSTLVRALHALVTISDANGEPAVAIQHAEEILLVEPYRETAFQALMRLHAAMGNRAEALRVFARCRDVLDRDLKIAPSRQTLETWKSIEVG